MLIIVNTKFLVRKKMKICHFSLILYHWQFIWKYASFEGVENELTA